MAQTGRGALEGPELPQFVRLKFEAICKCKNCGIGPFAFCQLRGNGIEDGSKDSVVRAGMLRKQAKKPIVVSDAVPGHGQFLENCQRGVRIGSQGLPDKGVRASREALQSSPISG
ncbi:hypothetical protein [Streptomyces sp. NPDC055109]